MILYTPINTSGKTVSIKDIRHSVRTGTFVQVRINDRYITDCLVLAQKDEKITRKTEFDGFFLEGNVVEPFTADQITAIGDRLGVDTGSKIISLF